MSKLTMAYLLIVAGIISIGAGIFLLTSNKGIGNSKTNSTNTKSTFDDNKAKGDAFEAYVVEQFDKNYFTLQEWRGDKYVNGNYPVSNHFPDLEVSFNWKDTKDHFAIECKWRKDYFQDAVEWAKGYQLKNYRDYAQKTNIPVYVIIGVGGTPSQPEDIFVIPLQKIEYEKLFKKTLEPFRKSGKPTFYWDAKTKELN